MPNSDSFFGKDKLYHLLVCFFATLFNPFLAVGLALGKEYGDSKAIGNHWCWKDLLADGIGILLGIIVLFLIHKGDILSWISQSIFSQVSQVLGSPVF